MSDYRKKAAQWAKIPSEGTLLEKVAVEGMEAGGLLMGRPAAAGGYLMASKAIDIANPAVGTLGYKWNRMMCILHNSKIKYRMTQTVIPGLVSDFIPNLNINT